MKTVLLTEFEQDFLKKYIFDRIDYYNQILEICDDGLYDCAENDYRKILEKLLALQRKL